MKNCKFYIAHALSQHANGLSESNSKQAKVILKSLVGSIQQAQVVFDSFIKVLATFERVADVLNQRPIFFDSDTILSVKGLMFPATLTAEETREAKMDFLADQQNQIPGIMDIIASHDQTFSDFCRIFHQSVIDGKYQRFGSKATR